ncbi:hypothetical protein HK405_007603, partial [Cladochytrium tenue]
MLLDLPNPVLRRVLLHSHPHDIQRLRRCCACLRDLLRLRCLDCDDSGSAGVNNLAVGDQARLLNLSFAQENLRASVAGWDGRVDSRQGIAVRDMALMWAKLGPDYLAALLCDYGFSADMVLLDCFPGLTDGPYSFQYAFAVLDCVRGRSHLSSRTKQGVADFMEGPISRLVTAAVRTALQNLPRVATPLARLLSDHLADWILLADDAELFHNSCRCRGEAGLPYFWGVTNAVGLLERLAKSDAVRIATRVALPPIYSDWALERAAKRPIIGFDTPQSVRDTNYRNWKGRVSNILRRIVDTGLIDQAVDGIILFNTYLDQCFADISLMESGHATIEAIKSGQAAILTELIEKVGLDGYSAPITFAKQRARKAFRPKTHIMSSLDESIGRHLLKVYNQRTGVNRNIFTDDYLAFVMLKDDGPLFAEYLSALDPEDEKNKNSVLGMSDIATDLNASNVVSHILRWAGGLREDALSRAIAAESSDVVRLLLSSDQGRRVPTDPKLLKLFSKHASESALLTLEALLESPCMDGRGFDALRPWALRAAYLQYPQTRGRVSEAEAHLRRRTRVLIERVLSPAVRKNLPEVLPILCALGRAASARELREGVPETADPRQWVRACVSEAAGDGEAEVVVGLLAAAAEVVMPTASAARGDGDGDGRRTGAVLVFVEEALTCAFQFDRAGVAEHVLQWCEQARVPREDVAFILRSRLLDNTLGNALLRPT